MANTNKPEDPNVVKATDVFFTKDPNCEKCARHQSECFVKDICKGFVDRTADRPANKFDQYDELKALTNHTNEGFLGKA